MTDKEKDSEKKIRELATDLINELLKRGEPISVDISTVGTAEKCGPKFVSCRNYDCIKKFKCQNTNGFECWGTFTDSADYKFTLG